MPKTLLLADDSVTIQKVVGISFASEDIQIVTVDNGRDAVTKARAVRPDIILADVVMPGMSGYEVCEAIKGDPNLRHVPVLLLTGTFEAFDEARATAVGAAGHVAKPFEAQTLVDRVKQLLAAVPPPAPAPAPMVAPVTARPQSPAAPTVPAARPAPAPPARSGEDAFDFFSDERTEPAPATARAPVSDPLELDEPDAAFAFGDDDLASDVQEPLRAPPLMPAGRRGEATVAILPTPTGRAPAAGDEFALGFDSGDPDALDEPLDPGQVSHTTLLDPPTGASYDVSSSDLGSPLAGTTPPPTQILATRFEGKVGRSIPPDFASAPPEPPARAVAADPLASDFDDLTDTDPFEEPARMRRLPRDPVMDMLAPEPRQAAPLWDDGPIADADVFAEPARPFGAEPDPEPQRSTPVATPVAEWPEDAEGDEWEEPFEVSPAAHKPAPMPQPTLLHEATAGQLSPAIAAELHDMLERIAWDAFAQVTEKVVRHAIERVEQVAWEIVPKLAETLIQEEIRRLKGGSDE